MGINFTISDRSTKYIVYAAALIVVALITYFAYTQWAISAGKRIPEAPTGLSGKAISATEIKLSWNDNSDNEEGFLVYRDGEPVGQVPSNKTKYTDSGLLPATSYEYAVVAFLKDKVSKHTSYVAVTNNPPIYIVLNRIGVIDNGEAYLRELLDDSGEVYIVIQVIDEGSEPFELRFPEKKYYLLADNEAIDVNLKIYETEEVGNSIGLVAIGIENDGGMAEQIIYELLGAATGSYIGTPASLIFSYAGVDFASIYGEIAGAGDDSLGSYSGVWDKNSDWGINQERYYIECTKPDGTVGLRLWFTIGSPSNIYNN
jgi:hypothetical protein